MNAGVPASPSSESSAEPGSAFTPAPKTADDAAPGDEPAPGRTSPEPAPPPVAPEQGRLARHLVVFCAALGGFVDLYCTQAIYPSLQSRFGISVAGAGALVTTTTLVLALFAPFASWFSHRVGARRATVGGLAGLTLSVFLMAFVDQTWQLMALRVMQGLLIPVVLASVLRSNQQLGGESDALALAGTYVSGTVLGGVVGRFLPAALVPAIGWTGAFLAFAFLHAALMVIVARLYAPPAAPATAPSAADARQPTAKPWLHIALLGMAGFALLFSQAATYTYIAIRFASEPYGWSTAQLGAIYLVFLPSLVFVRLSRSLVMRIGALAALKRAVLVSTGGLLLTLVSPALAIVAALVVFSVGIFVCQALLAHLVSAAEKEYEGVPVSGIYLCCYYLGASAGAIAPALLWADFGWPGCIALVIGVQLAAVTIAKLGGSRWRGARS